MNELLFMYAPDVMPEPAPDPEPAPPKEISEARLLANRNNAQKSTGAKTPAGRARSSLNAVRHGKCGRVVIYYSRQDVERHKQCREDLVKEHNPQGTEELNLIETAASFHFKINQAFTMEEGVLADEHEQAADFDTCNEEVHGAIALGRAYEVRQSTLNNSSTYLSRMFRNQQQAMKRFHELKAARLAKEAERLAKEATDIQKAIPVAKYFKMLGKTFDPKQLGFVCSAEQVEQELARQEIMEKVQIAIDSRFNKTEYERRVANRDMENRTEEELAHERLEALQKKRLAS